MAKGMRSPYANTGLTPFPQPIQITFDLLNLMENSAAADQQQFSFWGGHNPPVGAIYQGATHLLLKGA